MDFLDKYKYHKDDPREFGVELKDLKKASNELDNSHLSNLLTNSVRVDKEILPKVGEAIETVFKRIKIENNFNFFITADNNQAPTYLGADTTIRSADLINPFTLSHDLTNKKTTITFSEAPADKSIISIDYTGDKYLVFRRKGI